MVLFLFGDRKRHGVTIYRFINYNNQIYIIIFPNSENEDICIGKPLKETQFYFKNDCHKDSSIIEITEQILSNSYHEKYQGILYHSSQTRISLINGKREKIINSADTVSISNGKIYIRGRSDNSIKINGILTDLTKLEMVILYKNQFSL